KVIDQLKKDLPEDVKLTVSMDNTKYIRESIKEVADSILIAFILVVLIIFLFLRSWRTTLIPVLAIPISLIGAFFIMYVLNFSINILTLLAIVLAIGLVVDDAIVMMENIFAKIEQGMNPKEAALVGSKEIFFAVIATTVALVAVFFPIVFLQGVTGRLFREFSMVIAGAVVISTFVALSFTPMISMKILTANATDNRFYRASERFFENLTAGYGRSLQRFLRHRWIVFPMMALFLASIVWLWKALPSEMSPLEDRSSINVSSTASEGTSFDYMNRYAQKVGAVIDSLVPEQIAHLDMIGMGNTNRANFNIILKDIPDREATQQQIANRLTPHISKLTEARSFVSQRQTFGNSRGGLPVQYVIQAQEFEDLREIIPRFMEEVQQSPVFYASDVNLKFTKPELTVSIDRDKASMLGVSVQNIGQTLQLTMSEQRIGYFVANGKQYQIMSQIDRPQRNKPTDLTNIYVRNDYGDLIQLDNLVKTEESSMPPQLYRYNRFLSATISAGVVEGQTIGDGIAEMDRISKKVLDERFQTTLSGNSKDFVDSSSNMLFAFVFALILIYLVLAAQFESFRDPMIIMFTVPLTLAGALIALKAFGQTLNIFSEIGIIMLVGLVAKNGILIVEFANQRRQQGLSIIEAVQNASEGRLRPILMTSLSTIFGILPMAFATGSGAESRISMGIAVVGGMTFATILTLYVIPAIYSYMTSKKITIIETKNED
ncbi:MAG: efflux RND transporter permease subunit, partial [Rikenellaceae bacterium]|nr:efflux RND transporter permease subunit [Rikenellaceae bacterium]